MNTQELFQRAKDDLLADGKHAPVMYVEYTNKEGKLCVEMFYFADFGAETPLEEQMQLFGLGMKFGKERGEVDITQVTFIGEAWVSSMPIEKKEEFQRKYKRPEHDPNRTEALMMQITELMPTPSGKRELKQSFKRAQILRPTKDVIDLVPVTEELRITHRLFPTHFVLGYTSSQLSEDELREIFGQRH